VEEGKNQLGGKGRSGKKTLKDVDAEEGCGSGRRKKKGRSRQLKMWTIDGRDWLNQKNRWKMAEKERGEGREGEGRRQRNM
jgi:hypothetical protein